MVQALSAELQVELSLSWLHICRQPTWCSCPCCQSHQHRMQFSQVASPPEKKEVRPVLQAEEMVQPPLLPKPSAQDPTAQSIVVDNASFAWEASAQPMLNNISLTARWPSGSRPSFSSGAWELCWTLHGTVR